jgi:hypothetical protein
MEERAMTSRRVWQPTGPEPAKSSNWDIERQMARLRGVVEFNKTRRRRDDDPPAAAPVTATPRGPGGGLKGGAAAVRVFTD